MPRRVHFVTPENIDVSYELAGIGSRFVAAVIDHVIQAVVIVGILLLMSSISSGSNLLDRVGAGSAPFFVRALLGLVLFAILFGYFSFFELLWAGRTPGKRIAGLRVVKQGGYPIDPQASIVRNLLRIVDILPPPYGIGLISIFISSDYKRLGDYAAGTLVVKDQSAARFQRRERSHPSVTVTQFMPYVKNIDAVTAEEFHAIRQFVLRRHELDLAVQAQIGQRLAAPLLLKLGIEAPITVQLHYADILEAIERRYVEDRGLLSM